MRKCKVGCWFLLICVFIMTGCQASKEGNSEEVHSTSEAVVLETISQIPEEEKPISMGGFGTEIDGGILFNEKGLACYYDIEGGTLIPLCSRPDCLHEPYSFENLEPDCPAAILSRDGSFYGAYKGKLWYLKREEPDCSVLCQADMNGENVVERFEVPVVGNLSGNQILWNNCLYLASTRSIFDDNEIYVGTEYRLLGINLETGQEIEIEPARNYSGLLYRVLGMREDWLYYYYIPDATAEYPDGKVVRWNCKTKEKEELDFLAGSIKVCEWGGDYLVYSGERGEKDFYSAVYDLASGENREIAQTETLVYGYSAFSSEIIYYVAGEGFYRCQTDGSEQELLGEIELSVLTGLLPIYQVGEGYLIYGNSAGLFYVTRENFEQGGEVVPLADWELPTFPLMEDLETAP
jgi:hypothetical protein